MIKVFVAILFITCPLTAFLSGMNSAANSPEVVSRYRVHVEAEDYEGVIFPAEEAENFGLWASEGIDAYWTPSPDDIAQVEAALPDFLEANEDEFQRDIIDDLENYIRQYAGYESAGQRWIFINAICAHGDNFEWENDMVFVEDGGDCFFQLSYNVESGEFSNLMVNGQA